MPRKPWYSIIILLLCVLGKTGLAQSSLDMVYTIDEGLPSNTVYDIIQDSRGFIWIGTDAGLSRFDGYEFTNYSLEDGLPDVEILKFFKDSYDRIWMYTFNGKIGFLQGDSIYSSQNVPELIPLDFQSRITTILELDGSIYFSGRKDGIKRLDQNLQVISASIPDLHSGYLCYCNDQLFWFLRTFRKENSGPQKRITEENSMIVSTDDASLMELTTIDKDLDEFTINGLGYLYCHNDKVVTHGLKLNSSDLKVLDSKTLELTYSEKLEEPGVRILSIEQQGDRILVFAGTGIYEFDATTAALVEGQRVKDITSSTLDHEGNQWISTFNNGVIFKPLTLIHKAAVDFKKIDMLTEHQGELLVLHDAKFLSALDSNINPWPVFEFPNELSFSFLAARGDTALVAAHEGFFLIDLTNSKLIRQIRIPTSTGFEYRGDWYFGSLYSRLTRINGKTWETEYIPWSVERVHDLLVCEPDSILIATNKGLQVFKGKGDLVPFGNSFPEVRVSKIIKNNDQLWMTTSGQGVLKYEDGTLESFSTSEGMITNLYKEIIAVTDGIWASTTAGLSKIEFETSAITEISSRDGLDLSKINHMAVFNDELFLAQDAGLFHFRLDENFSELSNFKLFIDNVSAKSGTVSIQEGQKLPYDIGPVSLALKALVFKHKSSLVYQYRLVEESSTLPDWTATSSNQFNFSGLPAGRYEFEVRAKTKNSAWTPSTTFHFTIVPAYWQTLWFRMLILGTVLLIACMIFYSSTRNIRLKRKLQSDRVAAEIKALKAQINPHFLFNALNSIQSFLLSNENELAEEYLVKYSRLMRKILDHSSLLTIPLNDEIETIQLYVDLEKYRSRNSFRFIVTIDDSINAEEKIPSMILQPFIENAIWHGVSNQEDGLIQLHVKRENEDSILLEVSDNGKGFDQTKTKTSSKGSGLVQDRLALLNQMEGIKSKLTVKTEIDDGTVISIWVAGKL